MEEIKALTLEEIKEMIVDQVPWAFKAKTKAKWEKAKTQVKKKVVKKVTKKK